MPISEEQLTRWAKAPSETEEGGCQNAVSRITEVIKKEFGDSVRIFLQGSYKNRTNVKLDSDVDIVALHTGYYYPHVGFLSESDQKIYWDNFQPSQYTFADYKNTIHRILQNEFEPGEVERKNKCLKVKGSSYRVNADVVPCFVHKRFGELYTVSDEGIELLADDGIRIYSFPEQHYENGAEKNEETETMYKSVVRIVKNVRNELIDSGKITKDNMSSFFLESLVWNVLPNSHFKKNSYWDATRAVIATVWNEMREIERADKYTEVSGLKWLFRNGKTYEQAKLFMQHAWEYIGYEN